MISYQIAHDKKYPFETNSIAKSTNMTEDKGPKSNIAPYSQKTYKDDEIEM